MMTVLTSQSLTIASDTEVAASDKPIPPWPVQSTLIPPEVESDINKHAKDAASVHNRYKIQMVACF